MPRNEKNQDRELLVSSRASDRLRAARLWLESAPRDGEVWVVAPHRHAASELIHGEAGGTGSRFGVQALTLDRLAAQLAAHGLAHRGLAPASSLSMVAIATRAVHRLLESGSAGRFTDVGARPGFPHAVVRTLEELRAAQVSTDRLRSLAPWGPDLAAVIERIATERGELGLADRADVFRLAREAVERREEAGAVPAPAPLLLIDLPLTSKIEQDLVHALADAAPRVMALLPEGDEAVIARLETILGVRANRMKEGVPSRSLDLLQRHLFEESASAPRLLDDSVAFASWPGEARECVEIARQVLNEAAAGVPFDRIAVLLRSPSSYRAYVEEAMHRAEIPVYFAQGTTRPDPSGRALLALLSCAAEDLSARRFAEYLSLAQVPDPGAAAVDSWAPPEHDLVPGSPVDGANGTMDAAANGAVDSEHDAGGTPRAPWRWERLLVDAAVIGGQERWKRRLDGLVQEIALRRGELAEDDARLAGLTRTAADLEQLRAFALPLIARLARLPREATWGTWLEQLRELAGAAIRHPVAVLRVLSELEPLDPVGPVDLSMVQHVLRPRLCELAIPPRRRAGGAVYVGTIETARGLEFDVVFVPGLAEKLFPPRIIEDPLLPDEARRALPDAGLATQDSRVAAERLALRLAVGAAGRRVVLSWPRIDLEQARPRVPSFYGLEAFRAAEGRLPDFEELRRRGEAGQGARLGWPAPEEPAQAIDAAEYDLSVLARVKRAEPAERRGAAHYLLAANPILARALRARGRRWLRRWTYADGLVDPDPEAIQALARHRMGARAFSPTALENFSACPYRFFLQAVHRLQPREEMEALETIDPLTRGALFHEVQFRLLTTLRDEGRLPLNAERLEIAIARLDQAMDRVAAEYEERLAPAIPRVWMDAMNAIRADLREWLRRSVTESEKWVPHRFELSFGLAERSRPTADAASVPEPVRVLDDVLLRGSIDLVERSRDGTLRVTDHKTGKARVPAEAILNGGQTLQPILYALAAERVLEGTVESGRLYYCTADGDFTERTIPLDAVGRGHARTALGLVARALERGFLPAAPARDACRWCDYRPVCGPHEENRTARKPREGIADLLLLRGLP